MLTMDLVFTNHAIRRCQDMGISLDLAENIVRNYTTSWISISGRNRGRTYVNGSDPYAVIVAEPDEYGVRAIVTVVFRTQDKYERNGQGFKTTKKIKAENLAKQKPPVNYRKRKREKKKLRGES